MKKIYKRLIVFLICFISSITMIHAASDTPTPVYKKKLMYGVDRVTIYIDDKGSPRASYWEILIENAVNNWMYTGYGANPFYGIFVDSNVGSNIDIYAKERSFFGEFAYIVLSEVAWLDINEKSIHPDYNDWYSTTIYLNDAYLREDEISNEEATGTFAHEIGHAFGLAHNGTNEYRNL